MHFVQIGCPQANIEDDHTLHEASPPPPMYMFDKGFASFSLLTCKNLHKEKCTSIDMHDLEVDTYCDL